MSRVAQLDSVALDSELHHQLWSEFQKAVAPVRCKDEWQLLLHALVYSLGTRSAGCSTTTYGSSLSGISYNAGKASLFTVTILLNYLHKKISHRLFSRSSHGSSQVALLVRCYRALARLYKLCDLAVFFKFLSGRGSIYLSPWHELFNITCQDSLASSDFYQNTVYAGLEFQNRQLLWNGILELLNVDFLSTWLLRRSVAGRMRPKTSGGQGGAGRDGGCTYCGEAPVSPFAVSCCGAIYCYVCVVKCLEWGMCQGCAKTGEFVAKPVYDVAEESDGDSDGSESDGSESDDSDSDGSDSDGSSDDSGSNNLSY